MHTADGNEFPVRDPEFLAIMPGGRGIIVVTEDDAFEVIDVSMIASIHVGNGRRSKPRRGKSK